MPFRRWFSRVVVEGQSQRAITLESVPANISDDDEDLPTEEEGGQNTTGLTYRVGGGKVKLLEGGIVEYVETVERKLARATAK